jgi:hypothetical protein
LVGGTINQDIDEAKKRVATVVLVVANRRLQRLGRGRSDRPHPSTGRIAMMGRIIATDAHFSLRREGFCAFSSSRRWRREGAAFNGETGLRVLGVAGTLRPWKGEHPPASSTATRGVGSR